MHVSWLANRSSLRMKKFLGTRFSFATEWKITSARTILKLPRAPCSIASLLMGLDVLSDGRRAFVNCTRDMLLKDYVTLLPSSLTVVEILETVEPDDLVMAACQRLKEAGYMIALDDFTEEIKRAAR